MKWPKCQSENVKRFGKYGRRKVQRFRCKPCKVTFSEDQPKPLGNRYIDFEKAIQVVFLLMEGMSINAVSRFTGLHKVTILSLLTFAGEKCQEVSDSLVRRIRPHYVQLDELWTFVHTKERHLPSLRLNSGRNYGRRSTKPTAFGSFKWPENGRPGELRTTWADLIPLGVPRPPHFADSATPILVLVRVDYRRDVK